MSKTLQEWQSGSAKNHYIPTYSGIKRLCDLKHSPFDFTILKNKIDCWGEKIATLFPEHTSTIKQALTLFKAVEESSVLEVLHDAPTNLCFQRDKDTTSCNAMAFHCQTKKVIINESYLNTCFKQEKSVYGIGIFLRNLLHELNHAVQDKFGVLSIDQMGLINIKDALQLHFMNEIDSKLIEMRFFNELVSPFIQPETNLSHDPVFQEYFIQYALLSSTQKTDINTFHNQIDKNMIPYFITFAPNIEDYTPWQKSYIQQITGFLTGEIQVYDNITSQKSHPMTSYKLDYYENRYPMLSDLSNILPQQDFAKRIFNSFQLYEEIKKGKQPLPFEKCLCVYDAFNKNTWNQPEKASIQNMAKRTRYLIQKGIPIESAENLFKISYEKE